MRGKQFGADAELKWAAVPDIQMRGGDGGPLAGRPIGQEYDGLESGELAWIMGRKFLSQVGDGAADGSNPMAPFSQSAHALGMGYGPDRMQRLAYTSWMEAYFRAVFGSQTIALHALSLSGPSQTYMSDDLKRYTPYTGGASVLGSVDLPHVVNGLHSGTAPVVLQYTDSVDTTQDPPTKRLGPVKGQRGAADQEGLACGLLVVDKGPFLRGKIVNDDAVDMIAPDLLTPNGRNKIFHSTPRNMGDRLAFDALYAEMRTRNFFDWSPDGMVLSKLESPTGEPLSSAELDARQAQLFNVCIQGPAIAKTWTGDSKMQCLPLDKVFVVIVADISSETVADEKKGIGKAGDLVKKWDDYKKWVDGGRSGPAPSPESLDPDNTRGPYGDAVKELFEATKAAAGAAPADRASTATRVTNARAAIDAFFGGLQADYDDAVAGACKQGTIGFNASVMTNFRLMRVTSSFLTATSACVVDGTGNVDSKSRCGLRLGQSADKKTVTGEYIIGGWCIGTVIDSAASRSSIGNMVRTAPASMAININVNVEWWSGDDLHKRYMDIDQTVYQRGTRSTNLDVHDLNLDVSKASLEEALSWPKKTSP